MQNLYSFTRKETKIDSWWGSFDHACRCGHLSTARWLYETFELANYKSKTFDPLMHACDRGHLPIVQWLQATYNWIGAGIISNERGNANAHCTGISHMSLMNWAWLQGHIYTFRWLCTTFKTDWEVWNQWHVTSGLHQTLVAQGTWQDKCKWSVETHSQWYLQPMALAAAGHMPATLLTDVLRRM